MVSGNGTNADTSPVTGHRLSTVVPANVTSDVLHDLAGTDLALKLHYLRALYYFTPGEVVQGLTVYKLKEPMFRMLDVYKTAAGRIRRHESCRPHLKCNDSGVRFIEAVCDCTMEEWLASTVGEADRSLHLVYDRVLGPELSFSPPVYVQFTKFKCGGLAVGVNWAHVLGDAVSASNSMNLWGQFLSTNQPPPETKHQQKSDHRISSSVTGEPLSTKKVDPVGDFWLTPTKVQMAGVSFQISASRLKHLQSKISSHIPAFEAISALIWNCLAKIRAGKEPNLVTIIRNDTSEERKQILGNKLKISTTSTDSSVAKLDLSELATLIRDSKKDEKQAIDEMVDLENRKEDYVIYGANLTFVDMQGVDLYGLKLKGQKPAQVDYTIHGVGEEGVILLLPGADESRVLTAILPEEEIPELKEVLGSEWNIA